MIAGIIVIGPIVYVHGLHHGDGPLGCGAQLHKLVGAVVVPEAVAGTHAVLHVQSLHGPGAVVQTHPDDAPAVPIGRGSGPCPPQRQQQGGGKAQRYNLHEFSLHTVLHFSTSGGSVKLTL